MPVDKVRSNPIFSGKAQQQRAAKANLVFIIQYRSALLKVKGGADLIKAAENMDAQNTPLTDAQINYVGGIYEKTMKGMGFGSCPVKHDLVKKW